MCSCGIKIHQTKTPYIKTADEKEESDGIE
jgi:hypothetical protein